MWINQIRDILELFFLILIWKDGRNILEVERKNFNLYDTHINEIRSERLRRMGQLAAARQSKAIKAAKAKSENSQVKTSPRVLDESSKDGSGNNVTGG